MGNAQVQLMVARYTLGQKLWILKRKGAKTWKDAAICCEDCECSPKSPYFYVTSGGEVYPVDFRSCEERTETLAIDDCFEVHSI